MGRNGTTRGDGASIRLLSAVFLAVLLLFCTTVQLTHTHADGTSIRIARSARQPTGLCIRRLRHAFSKTFVFVPSTAVIYDRQYRDHFLSFSLWSRPPPDQHCEFLSSANSKNQRDHRRLPHAHVFAPHSLLPTRLLHLRR